MAKREHEDLILTALGTLLEKQKIFHGVTMHLLGTLYLEIQTVKDGKRYEVGERRELMNKFYDLVKELEGRFKAGIDQRVQLMSDIDEFLGGISGPAGSTGQ